MVNGKECIHRYVAKKTGWKRASEFRAAPDQTIRTPRRFSRGRDREFWIVDPPDFADFRGTMLRREKTRRKYADVAVF